MSLGRVAIQIDMVQYPGELRSSDIRWRLSRTMTRSSLGFWTPFQDRNVKRDHTQLGWRWGVVSSSDSPSHLPSPMSFVRVGHCSHHDAFSQAVSPAGDAWLISTHPLMFHVIINFSKKFYELSLPSPSENFPHFFLWISLGHYVCHTRL